MWLLCSCLLPLFAAALASGEESLPFEAKLIPPDQPPGATMGNAVAIEGGVLVAGARLDNAPTTNSGSAYIFERQARGAPWRPVQKLEPPGGEMGANFGWAVSVSAGRVVVSAQKINRVYLYERTGSTDEPWVLVREFTEPASGTYGRSVDLDGDRLIVGDIDHVGGGAAYIYDRDEGGADQWRLVQKLVGSDTAPGDVFGEGVVSDHDTVAVGAPLESFKGAVYVFEWNEALESWEETKKIAPSEGSFLDFGDTVDLDGDRLVVGAERETVNGVSEAGAAYLYERDLGGPENWGEVARLVASDSQPGDTLGESVGIAGDTVVAGADGAQDLGFDTGAIYVFQRREDGVWEEVYKLLPDGDKQVLGAAAAIEGSVIVGGAEADSGSTGAAYTYLLGPALWAAGSCPGFMTLGLAGGAPGELAGLGWSIQEGMYHLPGGLCVGVEFGLEQPRSIGVLPVQPDGQVFFEAEFPEIACGNYLQALDLATCTVSNTLAIPES